VQVCVSRPFAATYQPEVFVNYNHSEAVKTCSAHVIRVNYLPSKDIRRVCEKNFPLASAALGFISQRREWCWNLAETLFWDADILLRNVCEIQL